MYSFNDECSSYLISIPTACVGDFEVGVVVVGTGPVEEAGVGVQSAGGVTLAHVDHLLGGEAGLAVCQITRHVLMWRVITPRVVLCFCASATVTEAKKSAPTPQTTFEHPVLR